MNGKRHDRLRTLLPTAGEWRWCLYDVANSAFSLIVMTTMFPFFYARFVVPPDAPPGSATAGLGFANAAAGFAAAVAAPYLGALADRRGCRLVLNLDNIYTVQCASQAISEVIWFSRKQIPECGYSFHDEAVYRGEERFLEGKDILLPGMHNIENYMAAFAATDGYVSPETCRKIATTFGGVEHRIELVRTLNGVRYYNDSIASSPTRTIAGLRSFEQKLILIAGGHDKLVPFDLLAEEIVQRVKALFLVGETAEKIRNAVVSAPGYDAAALPITVLDDFRETVLAAAASARSGDVVILSPACSSFDRFKNFAERGNAFRKIVEELK